MDYFGPFWITLDHFIPFYSISFLSVILVHLSSLEVDSDQSEACLGTLSKKTTGKSGNFFQVGDPLPPVWEPHVCEEKKLWFILHFRTLGTFLVFIKMFTFWVVSWLEKVGMGDPPSLAGKNFHFPRFFPIKSTRGPKTKLT